MKITLENYTKNSDAMCAAAAKSCHTSETVSPESLSEKEIEGIINYVIQAGHTSVIEHSFYTFNIDDVSRVLTHQLVRHRIASYSQQSQRYVKVGEDGFVKPPKAIIENEIALTEYEKAIEDISYSYRKLIKLGIPEEDARYLLPNATKTSIVVSMNGRELLEDYFPLRCCARAQKEIRDMSYGMLTAVKTVSPVIFKKGGPKCVFGKCNELDRNEECRKTFEYIPKIEEISRDLREELKQLEKREYVETELDFLYYSPIVRIKKI